MKYSPYSEATNAEAYDRLALPIQFAEPAKDLVLFARASRGDRLLDVGSGTGAAAMPAAEAVGKSGSVTAVDASIEMLRRLKRKRICNVIVGKAPDLPFGDDSFDIVTACFVVSHFDSYEAGLADIVRVLAPGGRIVISAWAPGQNPYGQTWTEVASRFADLERLNRAFHEIIPWDDWFSGQTNLYIALEEAGLASITLSRRKYKIVVDVGDYLTLRELSVEGTFLRRLLSSDEWQGFRHDVSRVFRERFDETIKYDRDVHLARGVKPEHHPMMKPISKRAY